MKKLLIRMTRIRREREAGRTLAELIFGIWIISMIIAVTGTVFLPGRWYFLGGTAAGSAAATALVINMYDSIDAAVSMNEKRARRYASGHAVARIAATAVLLVLAIWIDVYCFAGLALGVASLKLSGLLHKPFSRLFSRLLGEEPYKDDEEALNRTDNDPDDDGQSLLRIK